MAPKIRKNLIKAAKPMLEDYNAIDLDVVIPKGGTGKYSYALVTLDSDITVRVNKIPNTTRTPPKFIAQNILKVARQAARQGENLACYGGGKG
jgi:hypothetical protein